MHYNGFEANRRVTPYAGVTRWFFLERDDGGKHAPSPPEGERGKVRGLSGGIFPVLQRETVDFSPSPQPSPSKGEGACFSFMLRKNYGFRNRAYSMQSDIAPFFLICFRSTPSRT